MLAIAVLAVTRLVLEVDYATSGDVLLFGDECIDDVTAEPAP